MLRKIMNIFLITLSFISLQILTSCNKNNSNIKDNKKYPITLLTNYGGKSQITIDQNVNRYIKNVDNLEYLAEALHSRELELNNNPKSRYDFQQLKIEWEDTNKNETYTVHIADNIDFLNEFTYETKRNFVDKEIGIFIPNVKYYYKVTGSISGESRVDSFIPNSRVRFISADTCLNVRDLGGWETKDFKIVNYGKIYRGAALNEYPNASYLSDDGRRVFEYLKIKGEIDLRGDDLVDVEKTRTDNYINKINKDYPILREGLYSFSYDEMTTNLEKAKNNLPMIFKFLADESNYPIFFHCSVGADRTGTLAYIIGALLGVDIKYLLLDYELTSFADKTTGGIRSRSIIEESGDSYRFKEPSSDDLSILGRLWYSHSLLMETYKDYSDDLQVVMEKYLIDSGVKESDIKSFKNIMLN